MSYYEVVVIGGGLFGSAAAKYAAEEFPDGKTLLIGPGAGMEEDPTTANFKHISESNRGHGSMLGGAWHDEGRISKLIEHGSVWQSFVKKSMARYRTIEKDSGINFFKEVGFLRVGVSTDEGAKSIHDLIQNLRQEGFDVNTVDQHYASTHFPYIRFPNDYIAYHQPNKSGHISPRRLVKAQQKIARLRYGCHFINGRAEDVKKHSEEMFSIKTMKYSTNNADRGAEAAETINIYAKRVIIATGAYANVKPNLQDILPEQMVKKIFAIEKFAQTVAMLEVSEEQVRDKLGTMPAMVTSYRAGPIDGTYILPPIRYPDGKYYVKIGHFQSFEKKLGNDENEMYSWYQSGGSKEASKEMSRFLAHDLIPDLEVINVKTNCCITTRGIGSKRRSPFIDTLIPGVTLILNGCGLGAKGSDEIGRIGAKLSTTNTWTSDEVQQDEARIQWKDL